MAKLNISGNLSIIGEENAIPNYCKIPTYTQVLNLTGTISNTTYNFSNIPTEGTLIGYLIRCGVYNYPGGTEVQFIPDMFADGSSGLMFMQNGTSNAYCIYYTLTSTGITVTGTNNTRSTTGIFVYAVTV